MSSIQGFYNQLLEIDLSSKQEKKIGVTDKLLQATLGGRGIGTYLLWKHLKKKVDPLSSKNILVLAVGPATGANVWGSSRVGVYSKSPLTGCYADSYSGGHVAPQIKKCGYDAIIIKGAASKPVYLEISAGEVKFHNAKDLWGKTTYKTEDEILDEIGDPNAQAMVIGPAGENLVRFACIENNYWRSAGRTGMGAVMGSKKLKGIIFHGDTRCSIAEPKMVDKFADEIVKRGKGDSGVKAYQKYGTPQMVSILNEAEAFPSEYWSKGKLEDWEDISAESLIEKCDVSPRACAKCFFACGNYTKISKGKHKGLTIEGPEYETIYAFGGLCKITDIKEIAYLNNICDKLGMDTITAGNRVALIIELSKRGRSEENLEYGNPDQVANLLNQIAKRKGMGEILAKGIKEVSEEWKCKDLAIHVKGLEPPGYDPRVLKGMGLGYATSPRGACHLTATFYKPELAGIIDPDTISGKTELFIKYEDRLTIFDTLILCRFYRDLVQWDELTSLLEALTGIEYSKDQLKNIAGDITTLRHMFNLREGLTKEDDLLPERFFEEPRKDDEKQVNKEEFMTMLEDYYRLRGWDQEGNPKELPEFLTNLHNGCS